MNDLNGDPRQPVGVAAPQWMSLDAAGTHLNIYAGVARPELASSDNQLVRPEVVVRLPGPVTEAFQAAASVHLASINSDENAFTIATDEAWVERDATNGDVLLHVSLAVQGNAAALHRFGYHVVVADATTRHTAVFHPSTDGEHQIYGASFEEFKALYDELYPQGWRVELVTVYALP